MQRMPSVAMLVRSSLLSSPILSKVLLERTRISLCSSAEFSLWILETLVYFNFQVFKCLHNTFLRKPMPLYQGNHSYALTIWHPRFIFVYVSFLKLFFCNDLFDWTGVFCSWYQSQDNKFHILLHIDLFFHNEIQSILIKSDGFITLIIHSFL